MESTLTIKGQATLPKAIRDHLRLRPGDRVKFFIHPDGTVLMLPRVPAGTLRGMLHRPGRRPVTLKQMDSAIAAGATEGHRRRKRR
jgi:AbrB family looped-hinge helix DNA binding protein